MDDENKKTTLIDKIALTDESFSKILDEMNTSNGVQDATTSLPKDKTPENIAFDVGTGLVTKTDIANQVSNYRESYTDTCFRRTAPYRGTMPVSFERWLRAVDICMQKSKGKRVKVEEVLGVYAQVEKESKSSYENLCRMTAEPFPLISSGRASSGSSDKVVEQPLIDPQNGSKTASRYARVSLSELGRLATRWYHDTPMSASSLIHKSIVPLSLLRKTQPWTLGFKTEMRPLNPSELFYLMIKMIENNSPELDDETLQQYFRGPDLGDDYNIFMTNESLMSLYSSGKGSITVAPAIEIDRVNNWIIVKRPVLDQTSEKLANMLNGKLLEGFKSNTREKIFNSFVMYDIVKASGKNTYIPVEKFIGTDEQIVAEITSMPDFQKTVALTNSVLLTNEGADASTSKYVGINYVCELMSVKDTLWMHINWERENLRKYYTLKREALVTALDKARLLDRVTRPKVADFIHSIMKMGDREDILYYTFNKNAEARASASRYNSIVGINCETFMDDLIAEGKQHPENHDYWYEGEYFSYEDANEVYRQKGGLKVDSETINILSILFLRDKYKDYWERFENAIKDCDEMLNNPQKLDGEILIELEKYASMAPLQRKSNVFFFKDDLREINRRKRVDQAIEESLMVKPSKIYDEVIQPVTIYYNQDTMYKSYGVNMNIYAKVSISRSSRKPQKAINCLNTDYLYLFTDCGVLPPFRPCDMSHMPYQYNNIQGIIPYSSNRRILMLTYYVEQGATISIMKTRVRIVKKTGLDFGLDTGEGLLSWIYLDDENGNPYDDDKKHFAFLLYRPDNYAGTYVNPETGLARVKPSDVEQLTNIFPERWGIATDVILIDANSQNVPEFCMWVYDSNIDRKIQAIQPTSSGVPSNYMIEMDGRGFSPHLEFYIGREFIGNWEEAGIVRIRNFEHGKKGVIQENRFLYRREAKSERILKQIRSRVIDKYQSIHTVTSTKTQAYDEWKLSDLSDWSVIDPRWGFPDERPTDQRVLDFCDDFFDRHVNFTTKITSSPKNILLKINLISDKKNVNKDITDSVDVSELKDGFFDNITEDDEIEINNNDNSLDEVYDLNNSADESE